MYLIIPKNFDFTQEPTYCILGVLKSKLTIESSFNLIGYEWKLERGL